MGKEKIKGRPKILDDYLGWATAGRIPKGKKRAKLQCHISQTSLGGGEMWHENFARFFPSGRENTRKFENF